jgi:hypothetical protein
LSGSRAKRPSWPALPLVLGDVPPKNARLYITFADGTRYERLVLPWVSDLDWPKVAGEIGRFNAAAYLAHQNSA